MFRAILTLFAAGLSFAAPALAAAPLGCEYNIVTTGGALTVDSCNGLEEEQAPFAAIEPNTGYRLVTGMRAPRANSLFGPFKVCVPIPQGVTVDSAAMTFNGTSQAFTTTTEGSADANVQYNYCVSYGAFRDQLAAGQDMLVGLDLTFDPISGPDARFFSGTNVGGTANACDDSTCWVEPLDRVTQPVNTYTADLEGCGFDILAETDTPTAPALCVDNPGAQTEGSFEPGSTHQLVYGLRVGQDADLPGTFAIRLPIPSGVTVGEARLFVTDRTSTTELFPGIDVTLALDTSTADAAIQGHYVATWTGNRDALVPGDKVWMSLDVTLGFFDATFTTASGVEGSLTSDCSGGGGNATVCPVDNLPALTMAVTQYTADLEGCGFDILPEGDPATPPVLCVDNPGAQTEGIFEPDTTHQLIYGMRVGENADLGGVYAIRLPVPVGVTVADPHLYLTTREGTTELVDLADISLGLDTSSADSQIQGHYVSTYSGGRAALVPGDKLWMSLDVTLGLFDATFTSASGEEGALTSDCSQGVGNATECPVDNLPALTMDVRQYTTNIQGCGFDLYAAGTTPVIPTTCADNPAPQTATAINAGETRLLTYGMRNPRGADAATITGNYRICLPMPLGVTYADTRLWSTPNGQLTATELTARFDLDEATADSVKAGDLCVSSALPATMEPGSTLWASVEITFGTTAATFGNASDVPGSVTTDCSQPGGNASVCPVDSLPLLTVPIVGQGEVLVAYASGRELSTSEDATTDSVTFTLSREPAADVSFTVASSDLGEGELVGSADVTLTPETWDTGVVVAVRGVNDDLVDGTQTLALEYSATTSTDGTFDGIAGGELLWSNADNDSAGATVTPAELATSETGTTAKFDVVLTAEPTAEVTLAIAGLDTTEGSLSTDSLTFNSSNWSNVQTVTVTGVDDAVVDGPVSYDLDLGPLVSTDTAFNGATVPSVRVINADDDSGGVTVTTSTGSGGEASLSTSESGTTDTVSFVLTSQPASTVTIPVSSSNTAEGTVDPAEIVFTRTNWDTPQEVTVTGVDDTLVDGTVALELLIAPMVSADTVYNDLDLDEVVWNNADDDSAGATVTPTTLATSESGTDATFDVVLTAEPTAEVTVAIAGLDATEGALSATTLSFDSTNWRDPQTVRVTGVDDAIVDGPVTYQLALGPLASTDAAFNDVAVSSVRVTNADNDTPGVTVTTDTGVGGEASLSTDESGTTDTVSLVLNTQPTDAVTIPVSSSDTSEGTVDPAELVFTTVNWNIPQEVTVTGVDDTLVDGTISLELLIAPMVSNDTDYDGIDLDDVVWDNADDDSASVVLDIDPDTTTLVTTEGGGTASFTAVLSAEPTASVSLTVSSSDTTEGTVATTLSFDGSNWNQPQTVTVTGVDDALQDGDIDYTVILEPLVSADTAFDGIDLADIPAVNEDDDSAGVRVDPASGTTTEAGGIFDFEISLSSAPTADVTVALVSDDTSEGTVSPASMVFTASNWNQPQVATVTGVDDSIVDGDVFYLITTTVTSADTGYDGISAADVSMTNEDDDTADLLLDGGGVIAALETSESGSTDSFTVALTAEPTADVTVSVVVDDATEATVSESSLVFTAANWQAAQTVTVTGVDDADVDGDIAFTITLTAASTDSTVAGVIGTIEGTNTDNDAAGVLVDPVEGLVTDELGATDTFEVVLTAAPSADVTIAISVDDTTEAEVDVSALTFTNANWDTPQVVTVTGLDDDLDDGDVPFTVALAAATSADIAFDGLDADDVSGTNLDDGRDGGDSGDTGDTAELMDSDTIWVQGGCSCSASGANPAALWLAPVGLLTLLRRRRAA